MQRVSSSLHARNVLKMFLAFAFLTNIVEAAKGTDAPKYADAMNFTNSTNATLEKAGHGSHLDMPFLILLWVKIIPCPKPTNCWHICNAEMYSTVALSCNYARPDW